jgi:hypothetical protein
LLDQRTFRAKMEQLAARGSRDKEATQCLNCERRAAPRGSILASEVSTVLGEVQTEELDDGPVQIAKPSGLIDASLSPAPDLT